MISVTSHVVWQDVPGELVLFDQQGNAYHALDAIGSEIWRQLAANGDVDAVIADLTERYDAPPERIAEDVRGFVATARDKGLLTDVV